jgi:LacI family transcriptional regulator
MILRPNDRKVRHVALAFPLGVAHLQPAVEGISDYARAHGEWSFTMSPETVTMPVQSLRGWRGDGAIAMLTTRRDVMAARTLGMPIVTFSGALRDPGVPRVIVDNHAIGTLAAEHLLACGFRRFAFYGLRNVAYTEDRGNAFAEVLSARGMNRCAVHLSPNAFTARRPWNDEMGKLERWLASLTPPVGLFAVNDQRARMVIDVCQRLSLNVPNEVGVLGVDNERMVCEFSDPPLSSIACDWYRVGYESAALLDQLMLRQPLATRQLRIPPLELIRRQSTDVIVVDDAIAAACVAYVREHIGEVFGVEALTAHVGVSRRSLELIFRRSMGCTPYQFVCRVRVAHAKELLSLPNRSKLSDVAKACGFRDLRRFRLVFRRNEKISPAEFRRRELGNIHV